MNANQAIHMIQDHGHKAFATPDGLLAMSTALVVDGVHADTQGDFGPAIELAYAFNKHALYTPGFDLILGNDCVFEESTVFEVRDDGSVDSAAIRRWLGY